MNPSIQLKKATPLFLIGLACFALVQSTEAVSPAPDGGYPHFTTAEGDTALQSLTTGLANTAVGFQALHSATNGSYNTGVGAGALDLNDGAENTAVGTGALLLNTAGNDNTANGAFALVRSTGNDNTATGARALVNNTAGNNNTAVGEAALLNNNTGSSNVAIGLQALANNISGNNNIAIGNVSGTGVTMANGVICIGNVGGADVDGTTFIGGIWGTTTQFNNAIPVLVDEAGQLGTVSSSRRYKTDIKPIDKASESILALKPVSFRYKVHKDTTPQFGLIAEEVAAVDPNLVVHDKNGEIYTVRYDAVNAMLLNEFLKEHRKVEEQQATIADLKSTVAQQRKDLEATTAQQQQEIQTLAATVKQQAAQIQKVSAQLEASKPAPQVVNNN